MPASSKRRMHWLSDYPYLCWCLSLSAIFLLIFSLGKRLRKVMLLGGMASAMYSLSAVFFVPDYWQPVLVLKSPVGLEDLFFSFANGGIVAFISLSAFRDRIILNYSPGEMVIKYLLCSNLGALLCWFIHQAGIPVMTSCLLAMPVVWLALLVKNRRHWPLSLMGALGFTLLYMVVTALLGLRFPDFHQQWAMENLLGVLFLGFPVEEYFWAFGFGAVFPLIMAYALGIQVAARREKHPQHAVA
jgi:hypothetical protein